MKTPETKNLDVNGQIKMAREYTRTWIAKGIFIVFVGLIVFVIIASFLKNKELSDYNILISPFIGLLGVILGFYFGKDTE